MGKTVNPVELAILLIVAGGFSFSAYRLFHEGPNLPIAGVTDSTWGTSSQEKREPAAIEPAFGHLESTCQVDQRATVKFAKIRISGPICGAKSSTDKKTIQGATVLNTANQFHATVFTDLSNGSFSTDYIPLNSEQNVIRLTFKFKSGKSTSHHITLKKE